MKTRRALLKNIAALMSGGQFSGQLTGAALAATVPQKAAQRQCESGLDAAPADSFVEFISVQTHLNWRDTVWDQMAWRPLLGDLGVRYTRSALGNQVARDHLLALFRDYGIRSSVTFNAINGDGSFDLDATLKILALLRDEIGSRKLYAIEGPNEYTHKYKTEGWADRMMSYQKFLYNAVKSDAGLSELAVLAPTIWKRLIEDYEAIGNMDAYADYGNLHLYNGGRKPGLFNRNEVDEKIDVAIAEAQIVVPRKPIYVTETGFNVADGTAPTRWTVPPAVAAKYTLRNLAELFLRRNLVKRVNIYSLIDDVHKKDHYELLDASSIGQSIVVVLGPANFSAIISGFRVPPPGRLAGGSSCSHHRRCGRAR